MRRIILLIPVLLLCSCNMKQKNNGNTVVINQDSIQHVQDSLNWVAQSKELYEKEGERIFGEFKFGMTTDEYYKQVELIKKETGGVVRIGNVDFKMEKNYSLYDDWGDYVWSPAFVPNELGGGLYELTIVTDRAWDETSSEFKGRMYENVSDWDTEQYKGAIDNVMNDIVAQLEKTYGEPHERVERTNWFDAKKTTIRWHFKHKNIVIHDDVYTSYRKQRANMTARNGNISVTLLSQVFKRCPVSITFTSIPLQEKRDSLIRVNNNIRRAAERRKDDSINAKKQSFTVGL